MARKASTASPEEKRAARNAARRESYRKQKTAVAKAAPVAPQRATAANRLARPAAPAPRPAASAVRPFRRRSDALIGATSKMPTSQWREYGVARGNNDRAGAAKILRDYRASLGRSAPSSLGSAIAKGRGAEYGLTKVGQAVQRFNPYRVGAVGALGLIAAGNAYRVAERAIDGFASDGTRGAARGIVNGVTFDFGGAAFDKVFGKADPAKERIPPRYTGENPAISTVRKRAEAINNRPTRKARDKMDRAQGITPQKPVPVPRPDDPFSKGEVVAAAAGSLAGLAAASGMYHATNSLGRALVKAAPLATRHPVGMALAVGAAAAAAGYAAFGPTPAKAETKKGRTAYDKTGVMHTQAEIESYRRGRR